MLAQRDRAWHSPADVSELIGVGKVPTIPGYQKVALVIRGKGQVQRITTRISRHQFVPDIPLDDLTKTSPSSS